jgi:hypothetical protein
MARWLLPTPLGPSSTIQILRNSFLTFLFRYTTVPFQPAFVLSANFSRRLHYMAVGVKTFKGLGFLGDADQQQ